MSERERQTRSKFADAASFYRDLSEEQKQGYQREYKKAQYKYHGKMYATTRGYIMARYYAGELIENGDLTGKESEKSPKRVSKSTKDKVQGTKDS